MPGDLRVGWRESTIISDSLRTPKARAFVVRGRE
jgi:hypothetical protein